MVLCTVLMNGERVLMKNKNTQTKVYKQYLSKCVGGIARSYSVLQDKFATALENNPDVKEFRLNVEVGKLPHFDAIYTSDFVVMYQDGTMHVWECVLRKHLTKPITSEILDLSRTHWTRRGVKWGVCTDAKK